MPEDQQIRTGTVRARALEADGQTLAAARERIFIAPMLKVKPPAKTTKRSGLIASLPTDQLQPNTSDDLGGWMAWPWR
jgi:outer membrane PBP1 activator LpoA protein